MADFEFNTQNEFGEESQVFTSQMIEAAVVVVLKMLFQTHFKVCQQVVNSKQALCHIL